jgi:hypothetical protein
VIYAGVTQPSYAEASAIVAKLTNLAVSAKQVERITKRIAEERCEERDKAVAAYATLPLVQRKGVPAGVTPPTVAVVGTDGGRLQVLDEQALAGRGRAIQVGLARKAAAQTAAATSPAPETLVQPTAPPTPTAGTVTAPPPASEVPAPPDAAAASLLVAPSADPAMVAATPTTADTGLAPAGPAAPTAIPTGTAARPSEDSSRFWREDKIGLLMAMTSEPTEADPCPEIPETFVDPLRMRQLVRELGKGVPLTEEAAGPAPDPAAAAEAWQQPARIWQPPQVQEKRLLATRQSWEAFGPMVAAAAWAMGLFGAARRAFLGDGAEVNWTVWRCYFGSFEPILDFIHALSYVYAAAHAGRGKTEGWKCYVTWIRWVWKGQVGKVLTALEERQAELGRPEPSDGDSHPRKVVEQAHTYLSNNQERMHYDRYRRMGLPITSSYVESAVKQFNQRIKGTEKFWGEAGAEGILQLRGDHLSDDQPLEAFWKRRQAQATGRRPYRQRRQRRAA